MQRSLILAAAAAAGVLAAGAALAQDSPEAAAQEAREHHMKLYAFNLGKLGAMAQGNMEYDAGAAQAAADNLLNMTEIDQVFYWLPGSAVGEVEGSRALPAIWENMDDFMAKHNALREAVANLQTVAGTDLASLQGAMGGVGGACGSCHETYRAPES